MGIENLPLMDMTHEEATHETIRDLRDLLDGLEPWQQEIAEAELRQLFAAQAGEHTHEV
jgi:hypothetical protein